MMSHDDDVHNPPRRGTRSWSTPDPVSRGRRYSHHSRRKNEKDGGFNTKNKSVSPFLLERETREREREKKKREKNRHHPITLSHHKRAHHSRVIAHTIVKKKNSSSSSSSSSPGSGSSPLGRTMRRERGANPKSSSFFWSVKVVVLR